MLRVQVILIVLLWNHEWNLKLCGLLRRGAITFLSLDVGFSSLFRTHPVQRETPRWSTFMWSLCVTVSFVQSNTYMISPCLKLRSRYTLCSIWFLSRTETQACVKVLSSFYWNKTLNKIMNTLVELNKLFNCASQYCNVDLWIVTLLHLHLTVILHF